MVITIIIYRVTYSGEINNLWLREAKKKVNRVDINIVSSGQVYMSYYGSDYER